MSDTPLQLRRELGLAGAVFTGLGSILGTGVFVSIGIAAGYAENHLVSAVVLAGIIACCNGLSSAQLAANHPISGGTYEYAYRWLNPWLGFTAGWMFLCAKCASAATAALAFSGYSTALFGSNTSIRVPVALLAIAAVTAVVLCGMKRSAIVNAIIVLLALSALMVFVVCGMRTTEISATSEDSTWSGILQATAFMFVAYTGYGRVATLGEEVEHPQQTIPVAIIVTIFCAMLVYVSVGVVGLKVVGAQEYSRLANESTAALQRISLRFDIPGVPTWVSIGALAASLGVLLNLILGLSRTVLAMGRRKDLPPVLATIGGPAQVPWVATCFVSVLIGGISLIGSVHLAWSFSAFTVLVYYSLTNWCALRLSKSERFLPRWISAMGLISCLTLAFWVDRQVWLFGFVLLIIGLAWRWFYRVFCAPNDSQSA